MAFILEEAVADDTTDMLTNANTPKAFPGGHGRDTNDTGYGVRTEGMQGCFTHTQVSSVINQEGKLIRCIWIIIVCQMTITLSSILLTEYVFLSFPRLKKEQVLLALFKVKKKKKKLGSSVSFHYQRYPKIPDRGWQRAKDWRHRTSEEPRKAFDLHWGDTGGFLWYHSCCSRRETSVSAHSNQ